MTIIHHDYLGRELNDGDFVVFHSYKTFQLGRIKKCTPKMVLVIGQDQSHKDWKTGEKAPFRKYGKECLKVDEKEVIVYLLKK